MIRNCHRLTALLLCCALLLGIGSAAAEKTLTLTFTGDCTLGSEESTRKDPYSFDSVVAKEGYDYFFANFREMFEKDDLTVINFEGVLSDSRAQETQRKRYRFRGPAEFVKILTGSSVEVAGVANNHIADFGKQGEESTKQILEEAGIEWIQESKYYLFEKDGIRIAIFAIHKSLNQKPDVFYRLISSLKQKKEEETPLPPAGKEEIPAPEAEAEADGI